MTKRLKVLWISVHVYVYSSLEQTVNEYEHLEAAVPVFAIRGYMLNVGH